MNKIERLALYAFYPIMFLIYFLIMFKININAIIGLPLLFLLAYFAIKHVANDRGKINTLVTAFLIYNLLSVVLYTFNGRPIDCYTTYIRQFAFPILFYYFGKTKNIDYYDYYKIFGLSCLVCLGVGLFLYITTPDFYISYLNDARHAKWYDDSEFVNESNLMAYTRFSAFWATPYAVSYLGIPSLCIGFLMSARSSSKPAIWSALVIISIISCILCFQRVAMACVLIYLLYIVFSGVIPSTKTIKVSLCVLVIAFLFTPYLLESFDSRFQIIKELLLGRLEVFSFSQAMSEGRSNQYDLVLRSWENPILGMGLGAASGTALSHGFPGVTDGEYVRILVESGVLGFCLFLLIVFKTILRGIKNRTNLWSELLVVLYFLVASIGSNALSIMHLFAPIFWFCIGRIWNEEYLADIKQNYKLYKI